MIYLFAAVSLLLGFLTGLKTNRTLNKKIEKLKKKNEDYKKKLF